jgi:hypothetical protein
MKLKTKRRKAPVRKASARSSKSIQARTPKNTDSVTGLPAVNCILMVMFAISALLRNSGPEGLAVEMVIRMLYLGLFKETAARSDARKARIYIFRIKEFWKYKALWDLLSWVVGFFE